MAVPIITSNGEVVGAVSVARYSGPPLPDGASSLVRLLVSLISGIFDHLAMVEEGRQLHKTLQSMTDATLSLAR